MSTSQSLNRSLQRRHVDAIPHESELSTCVVFLEVDGEPCNIPAGQIVHLLHFPERLKEVSVDYNRHFLLPPAERGNLDLHLRHQPLWAAAPIVRTSCPTREWGTLVLVGQDFPELFAHAPIRETNDLNLECALIKLSSGFRLLPVCE